MKEKDRIRLLEMVDRGTDFAGLWEELGETEDGTTGREAWWYAEDPVKAVERRLMLQAVSALGAIAFLLLRRDEELWEAWERY